MRRKRVRAVGSLHSAAYAAFRARLLKARILAGMTQTEAATAVGRPQSFIQKCEAGERRVDAVELHQLAKLYEQPLDWFFR